MKLLMEKIPPVIAHRARTLNSKIDWENAEYEIIPAKEATMLVKSDPAQAQNIYVVYHGSVYEINDEGTRLEAASYLRADDGDEYTRPNGTMVEKLHNMPLDHIFKIADYIYYTNERTTLRDPALLNKRAQYKQFKTGRHGFDGKDERRRTAQNNIEYMLKYIDDTKARVAKHEAEYQQILSNPPAPDASADELERYNSKLGWAKGDIKSAENDLAYYTQKLQAHYRELYERDPHRYDAARDALQAGMKKAKELIREINRLNSHITSEQERIKEAEKEIERANILLALRRENIKRQLKGLEPLPDPKGSERW